MAGDAVPASASSGEIGPILRRQRYRPARSDLIFEPLVRSHIRIEETGRNLVAPKSNRPPLLVARCALNPSRCGLAIERNDQGIVPEDVAVHGLRDVRARGRL